MAAARAARALDAANNGNSQPIFGSDLMHAIEINGLTKEYRVGFLRTRTKRALNSLNLQVEQGEVFGLLGPNGAGKTTSLKILFRLVFPTSGTARILGRELTDTAMHQRVGYLPENPYFYEHLSPEELLHYSGRLFGLGRDELRRRINQLLDRVGLAESRHVPLRRFPHRRWSLPWPWKRRPRSPPSLLPT